MLTKCRHYYPHFIIKEIEGWSNLFKITQPVSEVKPGCEPKSHWIRSLFSFGCTIRHASRIPVCSQTDQTVPLFPIATGWSKFGIMHKSKSNGQFIITQSSLKLGVWRQRFVAGVSDENWTCRELKWSPWTLLGMYIDTLTFWAQLIVI